jgi:hypothetical protein
VDAVPSNGATFERPAGYYLDVGIDSNWTGLDYVRVEVSTQNIPGQDGTLADDFVVGTTYLNESDAYPGIYTGSVGMFSALDGLYKIKPGLYYWQASSNTYPDTYFGPVLSFTVTAPAPPPPPAATPSPAPALSADDGEFYARAAIRKRFGRVRISIESCAVINPTSVRCSAIWKSKRFRYTGRVTLTDQGGDIYYRFSGVRKTKLKRR